MIFTPDQIRRLPGSLVRLADGRESLCGPIEIDYDTHSCFEPIIRQCFANKTHNIATTDEDIIAVLRWSDEPAQPTEVDALRAEVERLRLIIADVKRQVDGETNGPLGFIARRIAEMESVP
jgi:hypothetical protein